jgi:hypothetical protein
MRYLKLSLCVDAVKSSRTVNHVKIQHLETGSLAFGADVMSDVTV